MAPRKVNDGQSPEAQSDSRGAIKAFVVRTAMHNGIGHCLQSAAVNGRLPAWFENTADSTHGFLYRNRSSH